MHTAQLGSLFQSPQAIVIYLFCLWCFISYQIGIAGGWSALAKRFRKQSEPYGDSKSAGPFFYTIYLRLWIHYSSVIRVIAAADGLYLSVMLSLIHI